jgi:hypothetical protein
MVEEVAVAYACKQLANNESPRCRFFESKMTKLDNSIYYNFLNSFKCDLIY